MPTVTYEIDGTRRKARGAYTPVCMHFSYTVDGSISLARGAELMLPRFAQGAARTPGEVVAGCCDRSGVSAACAVHPDFAIP